MATRARLPGRPSSPLDRSADARVGGAYRAGGRAAATGSPARRRPLRHTRPAMNALFSLDGRTALVTGGSRGIGRMIAAGFLRAGCRAVYISSRKADACDATARELSSLGTCVSLPADVSDVQGVQALVAAFGEREQALDILVN